MGSGPEAEIPHPQASSHSPVAAARAEVFGQEVYQLEQAMAKRKVNRRALRRMKQKRARANTQKRLEARLAKRRQKSKVRR